MDYPQILESIVQATLNFIVVNSITSSAQQRTVTDMKTDLRTTKEDLMNELKDSRKNIIETIELANKKDKG